MIILVISIIIGIISGNFFIGLIAWLFLWFLSAGFRLIDALLSDKETAGIATLLGLAWLLGSDNDLDDNSDYDSDDFNL